MKLSWKQVNIYGFTPELFKQRIPTREELRQLGTQTPVPTPDENWNTVFIRQ